MCTEPWWLWPEWLPSADLSRGSHLSILIDVVFCKEFIQGLDSLSLNSYVNVTLSYVILAS